MHISQDVSAGVNGVKTYHDDRRPKPQNFLDGSSSINHVVKHVQSQGPLEVVTPNPVLLLPNLFKNFRVIGSKLECVDKSGGHGVLRSEKERQKNHGNFVVAVLSRKESGLLTVILGTSGKDHGSHPMVQKTLGLGLVILHPDLTGSTGSGEILHDSFPSLDSVVNFGTRDSEGEVDKLERDGDKPVLVVDLLLLGLSEVRADEHGKGGVHVEVSHLHHVLLSRGGIRHPLVEVASVDLLLNGEVDTTTLSVAVD